MPVVALGCPTLSRFARWKRAPLRKYLLCGNAFASREPATRTGHENRPRRFCWVRRKLARTPSYSPPALLTILRPQITCVTEKVDNLYKFQPYALCSALCSICSTSFVVFSVIAFTCHIIGKGRKEHRIREYVGSTSRAAKGGREMPRQM